MTVPTLDTPRLTLQPLTLDDAPAIQALFPHWEIVRFMNGRVPWPYPPDGAVTYLRNSALPAMAAGTEWHWTIRLKSAPDEMTGLVSLMTNPDNNRGFWIGLPWQGQGLATEAAGRATDHWFDELGHDVLRVPKAAANIASRRVSERMGMRLIAQETHDLVCGPTPCDLWEITREEWRRYRGL